MITTTRTDILIEENHSHPLLTHQLNVTKNRALRGGIRFQAQQERTLKIRLAQIVVTRIMIVQGREKGHHSLARGHPQAMTD